MSEISVLIIGSGGREHALAWKIAQSSKVNQVFVAPGNAGTAFEAKVSNVNISTLDFPALIKFVKENNISLTIVGPEAPLAAGIVDAFQQAGLAAFGPSQKAAQLEASKAFCKDFMQRHHIPTARYQHFTDLPSAKAYVLSHGCPIVIKADGLAAGKGVVIAQTEQEALNTLTEMLAGNAFGEAGHRVVIEEYLVGEEASFIVMADGHHVLPLATSQDHKARDDGDKGPNTGGMGAYSPAPIVTAALHEKIMQKVILPTIKGLADEGMPYTGFLYAGVMITPTGEIKVLEFNCRFGDPETQPILMRLDSDLVELCEAALAGNLDQMEIQWSDQVALGVVLAAGGYPGSYHQGDAISGLNHAFGNKVKVFHAGTKKADDQIVTAGGRVLCVTALADNLKQAQQAAYAAIQHINWPHIYYRHDIGFKGIATLGH